MDEMDKEKLEVAMALAGLAKLVDKQVERTYGDTEMEDKLVRNIATQDAERFVNTHKNKDFVFQNGTQGLNDKAGDLRQGCYALLAAALLSYRGDYENIKQNLIHTYRATPEEANAYMALCLEDIKSRSEEMDKVLELMREKGMAW